MLIPVIPGAYDVAGRRTSLLIGKAKHRFRTTYPIGRYLSGKLSVRCKSLDELRAFLQTCSYVSDQEQFGRADYWQPPEEFEKRRKGDCDDLAIWVWRQVMILGYDSRFVTGKSGRYGEGHAWVTVVIDGQHFIIESGFTITRRRLPRLSGIRYVPELSVSWDGKRVQCFEHTKPAYHPSLMQVGSLVAEWVWFWSRFWARVLFLIVTFPLRYKRRERTAEQAPDTSLQPTGRKMAGG